MVLNSQNESTYLEGPLGPERGDSFWLFNTNELFIILKKFPLTGLQVYFYCLLSIILFKRPHWELIGSVNCRMFRIPLFFTFKSNENTNHVISFYRTVIRVQHHKGSFLFLDIQRVFRRFLPGNNNKIRVVIK